MCLPIYDHDDAFFNDAIIEGCDVGSNLMVCLDPTSLLDIAGARDLHLKRLEVRESVDSFIILTYRHIYWLPESPVNRCLYGVSGLSFR